MELKDRKKAILKIIVDHYIGTGSPIGSKAVVENMDDKMSTATIRNEMAALEEMGFLVQPHTSAGRIPSDLAYRFYVDALLEMEPLSNKEITALKGAFNNQVSDVKQVIGDTVKVLSDITNCVALAMLPQSSEIQIQKVRLVPITSEKALVVIVTNHGVINDRVVRFPQGMSEGELTAISHLMSEQLTGVRDISMLQKDDFMQPIESHSALMHDVFDVFLNSLQDTDEKLILDGATKIFDFPEYQNVDRAKELIETFENKTVFAEILGKNEGEGIQVIIGGESEIEPISGCSLVTFSYNMPQLGKGSFGIVGPKRMNYGKVFKLMETLGKYINFEDFRKQEEK